VHNDIKSKNILLTKDAAVAKISDVGTSRILETTATTLSCPMLCTYAYAAPEQLMGTRDACTDKVSQCPPCMHHALAWARHQTIRQQIVHLTSHDRTEV